MVDRHIIPSREALVGNYETSISFTDFLWQALEYRVQTWTKFSCALCSAFVHETRKMGREDKLITLKKAVNFSWRPEWKYLPHTAAIPVQHTA